MVLGEISFEEFQDGRRSNSESLCHCDASHQGLAQSNLRFGRRSRLTYFKLAVMDSGMEQS